MSMESGMLRAVMEPITEAVRDRYAKIAIQMTDGGGGCCDCDCASGEAGVAVSGPTGEQLYPAESAQDVGVSLGVSLGCGNPTALADLHPGETVLDLGSGAGLDVLLSARRVSPGGHAYGVDMTDEMLRLANENKERA